ncbi:polysaccharide deacetylase family protein, partial [Clostridium perfringens]
YKEIKLANDVIARETVVQPRYVRTRSGDYPEAVPLAAAHLGMKAVVSYNINPKDRNMQSAEEIGEYVTRFISRGGIISMNTDVNPEVISSIKYIAQAVDDIGYRWVTLDELVRNGGERKPLELIPGYDAARMNPDYEQAKYELVYKVNT